MEFENRNLSRRLALEKRTKDFASAVLDYLDTLQLSVSTKVIAFQLGRSATSIGANYREANRAESRDDFKHKIGIVLKECSETEYWLELISDRNPRDMKVAHLRAEAEEFVKIFQRVTKTLAKSK